ncbi:MAG: hypothetical protein EOP83_16650 [Verrucomicrobiaceae bacterium]|nr:MAG: hypothetical protein EOP83_16650 [Verrucomicrobiaceae bacterium]
MMDEPEYISEVRVILDQHVDQARAQLAKLSGLLPAAAKSMEIVIFIDQDGEGFLDVRVSLEGPDLYVLNKAIEEAAVLFETKVVDGEMVPPLPLVDPDEDELPVQDILTDCAADWLRGVWEGMDHRGFRIPVVIVSHDGYGSRTPILLCPSA